MANNGYDIYNVLVMAFNHDEFRRYEFQFMQRNRRSFEQRKLVPRLKWVDSIETIRGYKDLPLVQVGNWMSHPDAEEILAYAMSHEIKIIEGRIE